MDKTPIYQKIDRLIFQKIESFIDNTEIKKFLDAYASLDEKVQEKIKMFLSAFVFALPLFILFLFHLNNSSLKKELEKKQELINLSNEFIQKNSLLTIEERQIVNPSPIIDEQSFQRVITQTLSSTGIDSSKVQTSNFQIDDQNPKIIQAQTDIKFSGISNDQLFDFINMLISKKIKIDNLSFKKNSSNLIDGLFTIFYYSKDSGNN